MAGKEPVAELDGRFSSEGAKATQWTQARGRLADAQVYWLSTVRPDGRPHVTPLLSGNPGRAWSTPVAARTSLRSGADHLICPCRQASECADTPLVA
jgi:hypothetical protein